ncbi:MAG: hypothetical protein HETSPECPRED_004823 [Heterodermia speciosa]|uniref:BTB domain-containing protein n=1 Tax=Heterodermia speciosa TaxID=116794 RepID=A0A8H3I953_9LECA|nr:MAG: hypothetical protein HETSPECPRED_004823 [Heterodermia speciosa]
MAHESTVHFANKLVHRRTQLEPVKSFLVEDLIMNKGSKKIAKHDSSDSDELVSIIVGHPPKSFKANRNRICVLSDCLNRAINSRKPTELGTEPGRLTVCLPEEDPLSFEIVFNWTITHTFKNPETEMAYFYTRLLDAYVLADRLGIKVVCNAILTELRNRAPDGLMDCHGFIYSNTIPGSVLRKMLVDMAVNDQRVAGVFQKGPQYGLHNPDFLFDLKNELVGKWKSS